MTDAPNDKPKAPAGATDPAFKATPRAAGKPEGGKPGVPPDGKQDAFKVIRSAPPPPSDGPGAGPIVAIIALVVIAVGGFLYTRRNAGAATTTTATTSTTALPAGKPAPDFVIGTIDDSESISGAAKALEKARGYRAEYPNAPNLEERIAELERKLGQTPASVSYEARLEEARSLLEQRKLDEGIEAASAVARDASEPRVLAAAHYLAAQGYAAKGDVPSAEVELQAAEEAGADKTTIDRMRSQLRGG